MKVRGSGGVQWKCSVERELHQVLLPLCRCRHFFLLPFLVAGVVLSTNASMSVVMKHRKCLLWGADNGFTSDIETGVDDARGIR